MTSRVDALRPGVPCSWRAEHMPTHLRSADGQLKNRRGQQLSYTSLFPPAHAHVRGVVLFLHGINEHCRRYFHLYEQLSERGFGALAYDLLGHGASDGAERAHTDDFAHLVDDTNDVLAFAKRKLLPTMLGGGADAAVDTPIIVMGFSLGTLVSLHTALSEQHAISALVLAAPAVSAEWTLALRVISWIIKPLALLAPTARIVPGVNHEWICRDPAFMADYDSDPFNVSGDMTARMGEQTLGAMAVLEKSAEVERAESALCAIPILFLMGSSDKVTSVPLARAFYERIASRDKEFKLFDGPFHAIFDDPDKDAVFDHLLEWLQARFP